MKWINNLIALLLGVIIITSCTDSIDEATVDLNFTLTYDSDPLVSFEELTYPLGFDVFFTKYSLFISDITLISDEGNHVLSPVEFIDLLTDVNSAEQAENGVNLTYTGVPARQYNAISFNIGLPEEVNATQPADYDISSPLSNNGEYWVGWKSYIFHKIEGKMDTDNDGTLESGIALHIGSDQAFRSVKINTPIDINSDREAIKLNFDLDQVLNINGAYYDFMETPQIHHIGALPKALPILDNTVNGLTVVQE